MVCLNLNGVPVEFPFQPYDVQEKFMGRMIECLQKGVNGLLESPTGTGKTLCLLCSSLGWLATRKAQIQMSGPETDLSANLKNQLGDATGLAWGDGSTPGAPKIIYASRTHSQLGQVIAELKRSSYRYMKVCVLGSRDQLCIHPEVSKEQNNAMKLHMCHARTTTRTCFYHTNLDAKKEDPDFREVLDIEDLVAVGKKHSACPYFMTKEIRKRADIIFMPYNYLLDPKVRKIHQIELQGNIIIFDEAHNVEKMCEESASIELRSLDIALCVDEVTQVMKKFQNDGEADPMGDFGSGSSSGSGPKDFSLEDLCILKTIFLELEKALDAVKISGPDGQTFPGEFMLQLLAKAELTPGKKDIILDLMDRVIQYLTVSSTSAYQRRGNGLQKFADLLKIVFSKTHFTEEHMERVKKSYKVHIKTEQPKTNSKSKSDGWNAAPAAKINTKAGRVLSYWCFSPGFGMRDLVEEGARCVILTSGTLSPLNSFAAELQVPFPVTLENPHIIASNQVLVGVVTHGPDGTPLDSTYKNRGNNQYLQSLGRTIRSVAQVVPDGLLVFFPSYPVLKSCQEAWQLSGLWDAINQVKPVFVEPTSKEAFQAAMVGYYGAVADGESRRGACFMAVCRGKVSEGLDFCDANGRAVIITGLPFPPSRDPRVLEKQKYLDDNRNRDPKIKGITGQQWYRLEATRAVNQAIGRVIRHRGDYGAILLCDQRFGSADLIQQLSAWVRPRVQTFSKFGLLPRDLGNFFRTVEPLFPASQRVAKPKVASIKTESSGSVDQYAAREALSLRSSRPQKQSSSTSASEKSKAPDFNLFQYSESVEKEQAIKKEKEAFDGRMFDGACHRPQIDFNQAPSTSISPTPSPDLNCYPSAHPPPPISVHSKIAVPATKRRKLTIVSNAEKARIETERRLEQALEQPLPTTEVSKKQQASDYLKRVRLALDPVRYQTFSAVIKSYKVDKDFEGLVRALKELFLKPTVNVELFTGFRQFVVKEHTSRFDEECAKLGGSFEG